MDPQNKSPFEIQKSLLTDLAIYSPFKKNLTDNFQKGCDALFARLKKDRASLAEEEHALQLELEATESQIEYDEGCIRAAFDVSLTELAMAQLKESMDFFDLSAEMRAEPVSKKTEEELEADLKETLLEKKKFVNVDLPNLEKKKNEIETKYQADLSQTKKDFRDQLQKKMSALRIAYADANAQCPHAYENGSVPATSETVPESLAIGSLLLTKKESDDDITADPEFRLPYWIDNRGAGNVVIKVDSAKGDYFDPKIENLICGLTLRFIESYPSGSLKVGVFSSYCSSMPKLNAIFSALNKAKMTLYGEACANQQKLALLLASVKTECGIVNNKLLENGAADLFELYARGMKTERFQLVVVHDAFREMTEENLREFYGCLSGYRPCGVRFLIIDDFSEKIYENKSAQFKKVLAQILALCQTLTYQEKIVLDETGKRVQPVTLSSTMTSQSVYDFTANYCALAAAKKKSYLPYESIGFGTMKPDPKNFDSIIIPAALNEPNIWQIEFNCIGHAPIANLIVGEPGTGKSTLIDSIIMNGAMKYSPDELIFELLDFKDGISSSVYTMAGCEIPHVKVVSQNNKPEEAEIVLSNILAESERRNKEFVRLREESHQAIRNIAEYNQTVSDPRYGRKNMPRLIIVIDECQYLFEDESLGKKCEDIVRKCRSQGIHLILATQAMSHSMWSTIKFVDGIYCFSVSKDDAEQLINRKYLPLIVTEIPKGSYRAFASNNHGEDCEKIQIAYDGGNTAKYAGMVREKWKDYPLDCVTIGAGERKSISLPDFQTILAAGEKGEVPLGENYSDHKTLYLNPKKARHLLMVGDNSAISEGINALVLRSAAQNQNHVFLVDASIKQTSTALAQQLSFGAEIFDERGYLSCLSAVEKLFKKREENIRIDYDPVYVILDNIPAMNDLLDNVKFTAGKAAPSEINPSMSFDEMMAAKQNALATASTEENISGKDTLFFLLSKAHQVNIFFVLSLDSLTLTTSQGEPALGYAQKNILRMCDYKVLFNHISGEVQTIMEDSFKSKILEGLNENMAYLSSRQDAFYKFRYFALEDAQ